MNAASRPVATTGRRRRRWRPPRSPRGSPWWESVAPAALATDVLSDQTQPAPPGCPDPAPPPELHPAPAQPPPEQVPPLGGAASRAGAAAAGRPGPACRARSRRRHTAATRSRSRSPSSRPWPRRRQGRAAATMGVTTSGWDAGRPERGGVPAEPRKASFMSSPGIAPPPWTGEPSARATCSCASVASIRNRSGAYVGICRVFVVGLANVGQGWGIAPRPRKRSQRSPYDLPGRLQVSLLAVAAVLFAGWQAPQAQADAEPATPVVADVATGVAEGAAPSLVTPAATTDTDEIAVDGEAPSQAEPHPAPGQEPVEPTSPGVPPASPGATPAPDRESRQPRPTRDAESRQPRPTRDAESRQPRPTRDAESRQPRPTRPTGAHHADRGTPAHTDAEPGHPRPIPDAESRQPRPTPDAEPPQARPAPEATKEHPAGAADVTTADSPAVAHPTAQSGSELKPTGPPHLEPAGRPAQVDAPDDEPAPARPPRARTRTAQAPSLPPSHAPAAPRRLAHESAPGAAYPAAPPRRVRKHAARQDRSVTRARGSQSRPTPEAPHRRGVPGAASAAAAAGNGTASPSNAVLSGEADLAPAGLVRPLRLSRPVLRPASVADPRERPG